MKIHLSATTSFLILIFFISCAGQNNSIFISVPDFSVYDNGKTIDKNSIINTKEGITVNSLPEWLLAFIDGGIEAVEMLDLYNDKYVFVGMNEGENFIALNKWAENFSAEHDFAVLAGNRIENRMVLTASLFPDDEYGAFFKTLVRIAYNQEFTGAQKEDTSWIKLSVNNDVSQNGNIDDNQNGVLRSSATEVYIFFILLTIDKDNMQTIIRNMMAQANAAVSVTNSQAASINRLRQTFFQGF